MRVLSTDSPGQYAELCINADTGVTAIKDTQGVQAGLVWVDSTLTLVWYASKR